MKLTPQRPQDKLFDSFLKSVKFQKANKEKKLYSEGYASTKDAMGAQL